MKASERIKVAEDALIRAAAHLNKARISRRDAHQPDAATEHLIDALAHVRGALTSVREAGYEIEVEEDEPRRG